MNKTTGYSPEVRERWDYKPTTIWKKHARRLRTNLRRLNMSRRNTKQSL